MIIGFMIILLASFLLGTFGLGMKYEKPLAWEGFWAIHAISGMVILPTIIALIVVPDLWQSISLAPQDATIRGIVFGFIWGIGGVLFGMSIKYVGVSLTYGIVMGTTGAIGALVPLFQISDFASKASFPYILVGVAVMIIGVAIVAMAGIKRERMVAASGQKIDGVKSGKEFWKGIVIVTLSGVFSAFINIGFANAAPVAKSAEALGAHPFGAGFAAWVVVLWGAIAFNLSYSVILLTKNKTWKTFVLPKSGKAYKWAVLSALLWFGSLGIYGIGASKMGEMGTIIGWPVNVGLSLIFSNFWAIRAGEWKGAKKQLQVMGIGVLILIVATVILGYASSVS